MKGYVFQPRKKEFDFTASTTNVENMRECQNGSLKDMAKTDESEHWDCMAVFNDMTMWNCDDLPSESDEMRRWKDWIDISKAIAE